MTIELTSAPPAAFGKAVVFACDGNYARQAMFAATQIARLHPDRDFDICICAMDEDLPEVPSLAEHRFRLCRVAAPGVFSGLFIDRRRTEAVYLRLALPRAFAADYRRVLYLDSDVFVQGGDFSAIMEVDLLGEALGAVRDNIQWRTPSRSPDFFRRLRLSHAPYFNSGVMLIDLPAFNDREILERCVEFGRRHRAQMDGHDQHLLNCVLHGAWAELSPLWNWQYTWATRFFETMADPHVVHFIGRTKPWSHSGGQMPLRFRRAYRRFFEVHFPGSPELGPDGPAPHRNRSLIRRSLLKHLVSTGKLCAYLDRFENDLSVVPSRAKPT